MTRSRGQFDTRHDDRPDPQGGDAPGGTLDRLRSWISFHRVEFLLVCWVVLGGVLVPLVFGLGTIVTSPESGIPQPIQSFFWTTVVLGVPLLTVSLYGHALVDGYHVALADGEITTGGRAALRVLQTVSALVFALGVLVMLEGTTPDAEFDPAALLSAFFLVLGIAGMLAFVAIDGIVRFFRGTW